MDVNQPNLHLSLPKWKIDSLNVYPGNYVAHKLKEIHEDSTSLFPESVYSTTSQKHRRWKSVTKSDFFEKEQVREITKENVNEQRLTTMFSKWKVPSRLTNGTDIDLPKVRSTERDTVPFKASRASAPAYLGGVSERLDVQTKSTDLKFYQNRPLQSPTKCRSNTANALSQKTQRDYLYDKNVKSLTAEQLQGKTTGDIVELFKRKGSLSTLTLRGKSTEQNQLRYIRLLSANSRAKKSEYQSWHHLPNYKDVDPVFNRKAIYSLSNVSTPRHFVIHPDWC